MYGNIYKLCIDTTILTGSQQAELCCCYRAEGRCQAIRIADPVGRCPAVRIIRIQWLIVDCTVRTYRNGLIRTDTGISRQHIQEFSRIHRDGHSIGTHTTSRGSCHNNNICSCISLKDRRNAVRIIKV
ncbi:hypothetical protein D3C86_1075920 [compost metagenome]